MADPKFRPCPQGQPMLLPPDLSDLVPENSMARVVDTIVEGMDRALLESLYPGGGAPAYDPAMMLKVVLLAYAQGVYSSREIARATAENVHFMWICGMQRLSHNTINRFRTDRIRPVFEEVFSEVLEFLALGGYVTLETYFLDGTKLEANANKHTHVWRKSAERYREKLRARVHAHLAAIDELEDEEEALCPGEPGEIDSERLADVSRRINERLAGERGRGGGRSAGERKRTRKVEACARKIERDYLPRMERYEGQLEAMGGRNSYSKTDPDATFMRMKDDPMGNGQLKAAYNVQIGTENQYVVCATVHQRPGDTACMVEHCEHLKERVGHVPAEFTADAGYGSEENYLYLEAEGVDAYVQHNEFHRECRDRKWREDEMRPANWDYDEWTDTYECPEGRTLTHTATRRRKSELGFEATTEVYECVDCGGCPRRERCFRSKDPGANRVVRVNERLARLKRRASEMLLSVRGSRLRKQRSDDVETVFGDIKRNLGFTRFLLRGLGKVTHEFRLVAAGHNIRKLALSLQADERAEARGLAFSC